MEALAAKAAVDVEGFYAARAPSVVAGSDVVVLSVDGKGIVMRPESLRAATAKAAEGAAPKLGTRLSKGEKRYRKRMAEIGAVYDLTPAVRTPEQVMARSADKDPIPKPPVAANKWVTASVVDDAAAVIAEVFDQAARRDPDHSRTWVALVDGNNHQINRIEADGLADALGALDQDRRLPAQGMPKLAVNHPGDVLRCAPHPCALHSIR